MIKSVKIFVHNNSLSNLLFDLKCSKWSQEKTNNNNIGKSPFLPDWQECCLSSLLEEVASDQHRVQISVTNSGHGGTDKAFFRIVNSGAYGSVLLPGVIIHTHFLLIFLFNLIKYEIANTLILF